MRAATKHIRPMRALLRHWPLLLLLAAIAGAWLSGLPQEIGWDGLSRHHADLTGWVQAHPMTAPAAFVATYAVVAGLSLPEAAIVTLAGGLLFGTFLGGTLAVIGSTLGSIVLFLAARHHLADALARRGGPFLERARARLERDGFLYLLAIRLVPLFPFWLVNLAAALCGMRLLPYVAATVLGIIPGTLIYASIGAGLSGVLATGTRPDLAMIFAPHILGPLIALAGLSLLPLGWRYVRRSHA